MLAAEYTAISAGIIPEKCSGITLSKKIRLIKAGIKTDKPEKNIKIPAGKKSFTGKGADNLSIFCITFMQYITDFYAVVFRKIKKIKNLSEINQYYR